MAARVLANGVSGTFEQRSLIDPTIGTSDGVMRRLEVAEVPEPSVLLAGGVVLLMGRRRRG